MTCYKNRIQLTNFKGQPAILGLKPVHYKTKLIQWCSQTVLKTKVKEVYIFLPISVLLYIAVLQCQQMQTRLMGWQALNLHHSLLTKKTVVLFLLILLDFKLFKISLSISFTIWQVSIINASGSRNTVMSTTCVPLAATHYYEL